MIVEISRTNIETEYEVHVPAWHEDSHVSSSTDAEIAIASALEQRAYGRDVVVVKIESFTFVMQGQEWSAERTSRLAFEKQGS